MKIKQAFLLIFFITNFILIYYTPDNIQSDYTNLIYILLLVILIQYVILGLIMDILKKKLIFGYIINFFAFIFILSSNEIFHETGEIIYRIEFLNLMINNPTILGWINDFAAIGIVLSFVFGLIFLIVKLVKK